MRLLLLLCALVPGAVSAQVYFGVKGGNVSAIDIASRKEWNVASLPSSDIDMLASDDSGVLYAVARASAEAPQVFTLVQGREKSGWTTSRVAAKSLACASGASTPLCDLMQVRARVAAKNVAQHGSRPPPPRQCGVEAPSEKRFGAPSLSTSLQVADELRWFRHGSFIVCFHGSGSEPIGAPGSDPFGIVLNDRYGLGVAEMLGKYDAVVLARRAPFPGVHAKELPAERAILVDFYNAMGGPGWINRTNWNSSESHCIWFGVTCDDDGNVEALSFSSNGLVGALPESIGGLRSLYSLTIQDGVGGALPASLGQLTQLRTLILMSITESSSGAGGFAGTIPASLATLPQLSTLTLAQFPKGIYFTCDRWSTGLTGTIPPGLLKPSVRRLTLSGSQLSGAFPTLSSLTNLQSLNITNNNFSGAIAVPPGTNITTVQLAGNSSDAEIRGGNCSGNRVPVAPPLAGRIPSAFWDGRKFTFIYIYSSDIEPNLATVANMPQLGSVALLLDTAEASLPADLGQSNPELSGVYVQSRSRFRPSGITGTFPAGLVSHPSLAYVSTFGTRMSGPLPARIADMPNLNYFFVRNSRFSGGFPEFSNLPEMEWIALSRNDISGDASRGLDGLPILKRLQLDDAALGGEVANNITQLTRLCAGAPDGEYCAAGAKGLDLSKNALTASAAVRTFIDSRSSAPATFVATQSPQPQGVSASVTATEAVVSFTAPGALAGTSTYRLFAGDRPDRITDCVASATSSPIRVPLSRFRGQAPRYFAVATSFLPSFDSSVDVAAASLNVTLSRREKLSRLSSPVGPIDMPPANGAPAIDGRMNGTWFNPSQSGHGITVQVVDNGCVRDVVMFWFVHANGEPTWLVAQGRVDGNRVRMDAVIANGSTGFPPAFDAAAASTAAWGEITLEFSSPDALTMSWAPTRAGFQPGTLPMTRLAALTADDPAGASLKRCHSGAWFDDARSGQGFVFETIARPNDTRELLGIMYTYQNGRPYWLIGTGPIVGDTATLALSSGRGAQFPPAFNASTVTISPWGSATVRFYDANSGRVSFTPTVAGFQASAMPIFRLTTLAGAVCRD